jgi:hypothetical protein
MQIISTEKTLFAVLARIVLYYLDIEGIRS